MEWATVVGVTAPFWMLGLLGGCILDLEFRAIVPNGEWSPDDEAAWTPADRRVIAAYFGDGGRNVFALVAPILLLPYSLAWWAIRRLIHAVRRRHVR